MTQEGEGRLPGLAAGIPDGARWMDAVLRRVEHALDETESLLASSPPPKGEAQGRLPAWPQRGPRRWVEAEGRLVVRCALTDAERCALHMAQRHGAIPELVAPAPGVEGTLWYHGLAAIRQVVIREEPGRMLLDVEAHGGGGGTRTLTVEIPARVDRGGPEVEGPGAPFTIRAPRAQCGESAAAVARECAEAWHDAVEEGRGLPRTEGMESMLREALEAQRSPGDAQRAPYKVVLMRSQNLLLQVDEAATDGQAAARQAHERVGNDDYAWLDGEHGEMGDEVGVIMVLGPDGKPRAVHDALAPASPAKVKELLVALRRTAAEGQGRLLDALETELGKTGLA